MMVDVTEAKVKCFSHDASSLLVVSTSSFFQPDSYTIHVYPFSPILIAEDSLLGRIVTPSSPFLKILTKTN